MLVRFPSVTVKTKVLHCVWSVSHLAVRLFFLHFANVSHWVILCIKSIISHHLSVSLPQFKEFSIVYNMALSPQLAAAVAIFFSAASLETFFLYMHLQAAPAVSFQLWASTLTSTVSSIQVCRPTLLDTIWDIFSNFCTKTWINWMDISTFFFERCLADWCPIMNLALKIAKFWLSKSIFYVKNYQNSSKFFFIEEYEIRSTTSINDTFNLL